MKVKYGDQALDPNVLFTVESGAPPDTVRTVEQFKEWRSAEDRAMLNECANEFRKRLQIAFEEFMREEREQQH